MGTKRTLATDEESGTVWGTVFQFAKASSEDSVRPLTGGTNSWGNGAIDLPIGSYSSFDTELDWYEIQFAVGPTVPLCEGVCVYGGPFLHLVEADLELRGRSSSSHNRYEYELEQHLEIGGYIGAQAELGDPNVLLGAEFLYTGEAWGAGIGVTILCP